ncbi:Zinc finger, FYVE/PHD-type [Niveomyces insectorum RCEF 264]|uniref:Zinc finger, FYVE/PHD-type n=1 Tax=Niveomyces insectorum RCEF 264 TaxID=1081102 RepID=A0A167R8J7_9HYPO|nr:Zinc finger, FYVE/PHD-type [Niveomyces insectorum RCEF 264]
MISSSFESRKRFTNAENNFDGRVYGEEENDRHDAQRQPIPGHDDGQLHASPIEKPCSPKIRHQHKKHVAAEFGDRNDSKDGFGQNDYLFGETHRADEIHDEDERGERGAEEDTLVRSPALGSPSKVSTQSGTPSIKSKRRNPLGNLVIDGTNKLTSGLGENLSRGDRIRSTPKKYLDSVESSSSRKRAGSQRGGSAFEEKVASPSLSHFDSQTDTPIKRATPRKKHAMPKSGILVTNESPSIAPARPTEKQPSGLAAPLVLTPVLNIFPIPTRIWAKNTKRNTAQDNAENGGNGEKMWAETRGITGNAERDVENDDETCAICGKPDSEPPNEIVFCENCDFAVHQRCYHVPVIPEGDWFCRHCSQLAQGSDDQRRQQNKQKGREVEGYAHMSEGLMSGAANVAKATATGASIFRDLTPDIANFEHHLSKWKRTLLSRCTGRSRVRLRGQDDAYDKTYQLVKQTVVAGEGNSLLIIGARGTGKTTMVESVLDDMTSEHEGAFHVVRLNGLIHTDDRLALREIWRQLGQEMAIEETITNQTNNYADTLTSLLAVFSHPSEIAAITNKEIVSSNKIGVTSTSVVFVIDEFDLFATHPRQTLLYNLFDIAQARKAPIAILGLTAKIDVVESLEKRVKSRFSHRQIPEGRAEFSQWWRYMIDSVREERDFKRQLEFHFYNSKSVLAFWTTCISPLAAVSSSAPRLCLPAIESSAVAKETAARVHSHTDVLSLRAPDSKLHLLTALSELELALLIVVARLDIILDTDTVNFALVYDEYISLIGKHRVQSLMATSGPIAAVKAVTEVRVETRADTGARARQGLETKAIGANSLVMSGGARVWGRNVTARAWERLAWLGLLLPVGMGGTRASWTSGTAGWGMWRAEVALEEIPAAPGVKLSTVLARWCREI